MDKINGIFKRLRESVEADEMSTKTKDELVSVLKDLLIGIQSVMLDQAGKQLEAVLENGDDRKVRAEAEEFLSLMKKRERQ